MRIRVTGGLGSSEVIILARQLSRLKRDKPSKSYWISKLQGELKIQNDIRDTFPFRPIYICYILFEVSKEFVGNSSDEIEQINSYCRKKLQDMNRH